MKKPIVKEFEKDALQKRIGIDSRDVRIISMLQEKPDTSQDEIATVLKISQPSVGARIKKLSSKGVLSKIQGFNFSKVDLQLAKIDVRTTDTAAVIKQFMHCPFFVNALVTSGRFNLCLFFAATELKRLEEIVNKYIRKNTAVKELELNVVISTSKDLVMPVTLAESCNECERCEGM